ncbi:MAG: DUF6057 family protein [Tannerellaceae bacterium]|jgi:hypothetical protein|nr:DUF6057 family protein [Tannerellaceae bacterium]
MEKQLLYASRALSILFGLIVFVFFGYYYPYHLAYQEQFQLFLFTPGYLAETVSVPGGPAVYVARFLTQFYYVPWQGAAVIALSLTGIQRLMLGVARAFGGKPALFPLSFLPSLFYWILLCDEHYMLAGVVALTGALAVVRLYVSVGRKALRAVCLFAALPPLYWFAGGACLVLALSGIFWEMKKGAYARRQLIGLAMGCLALMISFPLLAKALLAQYPLSRLWTGAGYYRFQTVFPSTLLLLWLLTGMLPVLFRCLPAASKAKAAWTGAGIMLAALIVITCRGIAETSDWQKEEAMAYDYHARRRQWGDIIRMAGKKAPATPLPVALLNLSLCKQGRMADDMFRYFQNGPEGLLPSFVRDFTMPMMAGEVYYHLGFVNTAQRFAFEAMEAIPDYQKSARAIKRLAETNLINGEYAVTRKYLQILRHTLYYSKWAAQTLALLEDEEKIAASPEWHTLRACRTRTAFLFSEQEKSQMLGVLLQQNPANRMAYEYLMAYCLLTKDLQHFYSYYPLGKETACRQIPLSYQEALIYLWGLSNDNPSTIPYPISNEVKRRVQEYGKIYTSYPHSEPMLRPQYADTYWYYLHFRK